MTGPSTPLRYLFKNCSLQLRRPRRTPSDATFDKIMTIPFASGKVEKNAVTRYFHRSPPVIPESTVVCVDVSVDLQESFEAVDTDKDGVINVDQLEQVAQRLGLNITRQQAETMMSSFGKAG